jgi:hypothetical protein
MFVLISGSLPYPWTSCSCFTCCFPCSTHRTCHRQASTNLMFLPLNLEMRGRLGKPPKAAAGRCGGSFGRKWPKDPKKTVVFPGVLWKLSAPPVPLHCNSGVRRGWVPCDARGIANKHGFTRLAAEVVLDARSVSCIFYHGMRGFHLFCAWILLWWM